MKAGRTQGSPLQFDPPRILLIGFPIRLLQLDRIVVGRWLNIPGGIAGAAHDGVLASGWILPVIRPEGPGVRIVVRIVDRSPSPVPILHLEFPLGQSIL